MIDFWLPQNECTGCGACESICPANAISLELQEGFYEVKIESTCIECKKCIGVCQNRHSVSRQNSIAPSVFSAFSKNDTLRFSSTSGALFSELAKTIIDKNGVVVGAAYDKNNVIKHKAIANKEDIELLRQSKYAQSFMGKTFREVEQFLKHEQVVLFCGTPCQIAGLKGFLGKEWDSLFTLDFVCRGVGSPVAFKSWLEELEHTYNSAIKHVWFKYKNQGWKASPLNTRIDFINGRNIVLDKSTNLYMQGYLYSNILIRPSCGQCQFKGFPRIADITVGDFWGIQDDDDKGISLVMVNNEKGEQILGSTNSNLIISPQDIEEAITGNLMIVHSVQRNPKSADFINSLSSKSFSKALKKYYRNKKGLIRKLSSAINS